MDNEAFRALVQERAKVKSTKEIAREAVEEEFRKRKKRKRRGGGGDSSSEDDSDDASDQEKPLKQDLLVPVAAKKKARNEESKYRDRAKERREGKNVEYEAQASLLEGVAAAAAADGEMDQVTMSKYLGGDEAHTHLVKGLDIALARRVKREMSKETKDTEVKGASTKPTKTKEPLVIVRNEVEARILLQRIQPASVSSELGRQMLFYMRNIHLPSEVLSDLTFRQSPAGRAIQRTNLTFSMMGDPRDHSRAWDLPLESMQASTTDVYDAETYGAISLDKTLLRQIQRAFSNENTTGQQQCANEGAEENADESHFDDDDDDIFNEDSEYVPPTETETSKAKSISHDGMKKSIVTGGSIFDGLIAAKSLQSQSVGHAHSTTQKPEGPLKKLKVIDRDVLGSMAQASSKITSQIGVSVSSYSGGYGEEMDVDFDGRFAHEDDDEIGGKRKAMSKDRTA